ncbi:hypothetical protein [Pontimicrobium sp. MEBiC06410]
MKNSFKNLANKLYQLGIIDKETKDKFNVSLFEKVSKKKEEEKNKYIKVLERKAKLDILMEILEKDNVYILENEKKVIELLDSIGIEVLP